MTYIYIYVAIAVLLSCDTQAIIAEGVPEALTRRIHHAAWLVENNLSNEENGDYNRVFCWGI